MKSFNDFEKMFKDFSKVIANNLESDSVELLIDLMHFMEKNDFECKVIRNFYDDDDLKVMFITDDIHNNNGYVFLQVCENKKTNRYYMLSSIYKYNDLGKLVLQIKDGIYKYKKKQLSLVIERHPCYTGVNPLNKENQQFVSFSLFMKQIVAYSKFLYG